MLIFDPYHVMPNTTHTHLQIAGLICGIADPRRLRKYMGAHPRSGQEQQKSPI